MGTPKVLLGFCLLDMSALIRLQCKYCLQNADPVIFVIQNWKFSMCQHPADMPMVVLEGK